MAAGTVVVLLLGGGVIGVAALAIPITLASQIPMLWMIRRSLPTCASGGAARSAGWLVESPASAPPSSSSTAPRSSSRRPMSW